MSATRVPSAKRYTPEQREEALRLYVEVGAGEAARRTGIPRGTISVWATRDGRKQPREQRMRAAWQARDMAFADRRSRLADEAGAAAEEVLARLRREDQSLHVERLAKAWSLLVEKGQLLSGGATQRVARELSAEEARRRLAERADDDLARRRTARAP